MKKLEWGKYALIYLAGFLTSFSGALDSEVVNKNWPPL